MQRTTDKFLSLASLLSQTLSKAASNTFLTSLSGGLTLSDAFIRGIEHQCSLSTRPGTWASILELAELASTLNRSIKAIYPKIFGLLTQKYMNTVYHPRQSTPSVDEATTCSVVTIMWSTTQTVWHGLQPHPNHFVPCVCGMKNLTANL